MNKGFAGVYIVIGILIVAAIIGGTYYFGKTSLQQVPQTPSPSTTPSSQTRPDQTLTPALTPDKINKLQVVSIDRVEPPEGKVGSKITLTGNFDSINDIAFSGQNGGGYINYVASADGKRLTFVIHGGLSMCPMTQVEVCAAAILNLPKGEAEIWVVNKNGKSNKKKFRFLE